MELATIKAKVRHTRGKNAARALRRQGMVPAVIYGPNRQPESLSVDKRDLEMMLRRVAETQAPVEVVIDENNPEKIRVLVREVQSHPVSKQLIHVDFHEFEKSRKIRVMVPVVTKGKAQGVEMGGLLQVIRRELEVFCLPMEIPESIEIDVSDLNIGDSIHVEELDLKGDIEIIADVNFTIATVLAAKSEKEEEVLEEEEEEGEEAEGEEDASE